MEFTGILALLMGLGILATGYTFLVLILPFISKRTDTSVSIEAMRASSWLIIGGLIIIILGFLYLMEIVPLSI